MRVIEAVEAVDVFVNEGGTITIQQYDAMGGDDALIVVPPGRVNDLCRALKQAAADAKQQGE